MHGRYYVCPLGYGMLWLNTHLINYAIPEDQWLRKSLVRAHAHTARKKGGDGNEEKHGGEDIWGGHMWTRQDDEDGDRHDTDGFGLLRKVDSYVGHSLPLAVYSSRIPTGDQTRRTTFARFSWAHSNVWRTHFRTGQKSIPALARVR